MANETITRYDMEQADADGEDMKMSTHPKGDYVTFDDHNDIVVALQDELTAVKGKVEQALVYLNEI